MACSIVSDCGCGRWGSNVNESESRVPSPARQSTDDQLWEKVSALSPRLRQHVRVYPQSFRGERWYVLRDESSGQHLRVNSVAFALIGRLDGRRSIATVFDYLQAEGSTLSRTSVVQLISHLQHIGALYGVLDKGAEQLMEEYRKKKSGLRWRRLLSPLLIRIPLIDPDALLTRIAPYVGSLLRLRAFVVWSAVVLMGLLVLITNLPDVLDEVRHEVLKPSNLVLLWVLYPLLKLLHEFAHALCVKYWGGEVHEMGITFLVLTPVPYVDASAASSFKSKYKRIVVSAAGIAVELFVASLALAFWVTAEPGFLRDCAFGLFTIGAFSTVMFNANPLLKFDGYYILQDLIEIPNLYSRSTAYYRYLTKRYVFGMENVESPQTAAGENRWFIGYGMASQLYRLFVMVFIVLFLSSRYLLLGALLGAWAVFQQLLQPLYKGCVYLVKSAELHSVRRQALVRLGSIAMFLLAALCLIPVPNATQVQGVVWVPEQGQIFAGTAGFVEKLLVQPGDRVKQGQVLLLLSNDDLKREIVSLQSEIRVHEINASSIRRSDAAEYSRLNSDIAVLQKELDVRLREHEELVVKSGAAGVFAPPGAMTLQGRYYAQGDLIGHVVDRERLVVQVAIPEKKSGSLHQGVSSAKVRLAENPGISLPATVQQETPSANHTLPSAALGAGGGGGIAVASTDSAGLTAVEKVFHLQLGLEAGAPVFGVGERAYVSLRHSAEPLMSRWVRSFQQLFLEKLPA